jgi:hypothetical protein
MGICNAELHFPYCINPRHMIILKSIHGRKMIMDVNAAGWDTVAGAAPDKYMSSFQII